MILRKITQENIKRLNWFDTVYILENPINNSNENPKICQVLSFSEGKSKYNLIEGNFYCLNSIRLD
jgi:hypothetical protein